MMQELAKALAAATEEHSLTGEKVVDRYDWSFRFLSREQLHHMLPNWRESALEVDPAEVELDKPIIVSRELTGLALWDGAHRAISALMLGAENLLVAYGRPIPGLHPDYSDMTPKPG